MVWKLVSPSRLDHFGADDLSRRRVLQRRIDPEARPRAGQRSLEDVGGVRLLGDPLQVLGRIIRLVLQPELSQHPVDLAVAQDVDVAGLVKVGDDEGRKGGPPFVEGRVARAVLEIQDRQQRLARGGDGDVLLQDDEPEHERRRDDENSRRDRHGHLLDVERDRDLLGRVRPLLRRDALGRRQGLFDASQLGGEIGRALEPLLPVLLQAAQDEPAQVRRDLRIELAGIARRLALVLDPDRERRVALERDAPGRHLVEDDPERVEVGAGVDGLALDLLRAHVFRRPDHDPGPGDALLLERAGDAEIHDVDAAALVDHDVLRLEVAVDDAVAVGLGQAFRDLARDRHGPAGRQLADLADEALEVLAVDVFHGDERRPVRPADVEHPADVPVDDRAGRLELVAEALDRLGVGGHFGPEELQGDLLVELGVVDLVDAAHAAPAELFDDLVPPGEDRSGRELPEGACMVSVSTAADSSGAAHWPQNLVSAGLSCRQRGHFTVIRSPSFVFLAGRIARGTGEVNAGATDPQWVGPTNGVGPQQYECYQWIKPRKAPIIGLISLFLGPKTRGSISLRSFPESTFLASKSPI